jgi:copper chaperone
VAGFNLPTDSNCVAAVKPHLDSDPAIRHWSVDTADPSKVLTVEGDGVTAEAVRRHVADAGFKVLGPIEQTSAPSPAVPVAPERSFLETYRPLLLVFGYLIGIIGPSVPVATIWAKGFERTIHPLPSRTRTAA